MYAVIMGLLTGIGLSATCGFRVFVPLLIMSIAAHAGHLELAQGFEWIGSTPAIIAFSVATLLEVGAYYIPWLDNLLDTIATPAAAVAGIIVTASAVSGMSPLLQWSLAIIAGGGAAAVVQSTTVVTRGTSSVTTWGTANPVVSTLELILSIVSSILIICLPILTILLLGLVAYLIIKKIRKRKQAEQAQTEVLQAETT